jgi:hypothetical protein
MRTVRLTLSTLSFEIAPTVIINAVIMDYDSSIDSFITHGYIYTALTQKQLKSKWLSLRLFIILTQSPYINYRTQIKQRILPRNNQNHNGE